MRTWGTVLAIFYVNFKIKTYFKFKTQVHNSNANLGHPHCRGYFFVYVVES
jgi:hypothetical protein